MKQIKFSFSDKKLNITLPQNKAEAIMNSLDQIVKVTDQYGKWTGQTINKALLTATDVDWEATKQSDQEDAWKANADLPRLEAESAERYAKRTPEVKASELNRFKMYYFIRSGFTEHCFEPPQAALDEAQAVQLAFFKENKDTLHTPMDLLEPLFKKHLGKLYKYNGDINSITLKKPVPSYREDAINTPPNEPQGTEGEEKVENDNSLASEF